MSADTTSEGGLRCRRYASTRVRRLVLAVTAVALLVPAPAHAERAVRAGQRHGVWWSSTPTAPATVSRYACGITGLQSGEAVVGIDMRPATGQLYGVGSSGRLYLIDGAVRTRQRRRIRRRSSLAGARVSASISIRPSIVSGSSATRARTCGSTPTRAPSCSPMARLTAGFGVTAAGLHQQLRRRDHHDARSISTPTGDQLLLQNPPNAGTLTVVGAARRRRHPRRRARHQRHDRSAPSSPTRSADQARLYTVNLTTGVAAAPAGHHRRWLPGGHRARHLTSRAVRHVGPHRHQRPHLLLQRGAGRGVRARRGTPACRAAKRSLGHRRAGRPPGPCTGCGSSGRALRASIASRASRQPSAGPFGALNGTAFGFDFNPTVDRIRIVSNAGQNLRLPSRTPARSAATDGAPDAVRVGDRRGVHRTTAPARRRPRSTTSTRRPTRC